jgi:hypothetical protein
LRVAVVAHEQVAFFGQRAQHIDQGPSTQRQQSPAWSW